MLMRSALLLALRQGDQEGVQEGGVMDITSLAGVGIGTVYAA